MKKCEIDLVYLTRMESIADEYSERLDIPDKVIFEMYERFYCSLEALKEHPELYHAEIWDRAVFSHNRILFLMSKRISEFRGAYSSR